MAFDYPVTLDLEGRLCLLAGDGPVAVEQLTGLLRSRADVMVVTPGPSQGLAWQCLAFDVPLVERLLEPEDLDGATLAIVTGEDVTDVSMLHAAARDRGVLFAALGAVEHCDVGALGQIRRGALTVTVSSGDRAAVVANRLRRHLEDTLTHDLAELADVVDEATALHGLRDAPDTWATRWETALEDFESLLSMLGDGRRDEVRDHILSTLSAD